MAAVLSIAVPLPRQQWRASRKHGVRDSYNDDGRAQGFSAPDEAAI